MPIQTATPYLVLNGRAVQAIELYQQAFGAEVEALQRFGDVDAHCPAAQKNQIMHAVLRIGSARIMLSDGGQQAPLPTGGVVSVALNWDDAGQARQSFEALGRTGVVIQPLFAAPWGALFGVVQDALGVPWMFNVEGKK